MHYELDRVAEFRRNELLRDAQRMRLARLAMTGKRASVRYSVGCFLTRFGCWLSGEPRQETRPAGADRWAQRGALVATRESGEV